MQEMAPKGSYQLVVQDAVNDLSVPYHIMTKEYNDRVKQVLTDDARNQRKCSRRASISKEVDRSRRNESSRGVGYGRGTLCGLAQDYSRRVGQGRANLLVCHRKLTGFK